MINPKTLAGTGAGRFAVATTDGLRGAVMQLTGVTVSVSNAAPTVEITSPRRGGSVARPACSRSSSRRSRATATRTLDDDAIVWTRTVTASSAAARR